MEIYIVTTPPYCECGYSNGIVIDSVHASAEKAEERRKQLVGEYLRANHATAEHAAVEVALGVIDGLATRLHKSCLSRSDQLYKVVKHVVE